VLPPFADAQGRKNRVALGGHAGHRKEKTEKE
jgi:hypothetical protein